VEQERKMKLLPLIILLAFIVACQPSQQQTAPAQNADIEPVAQSPPSSDNPLKVLDTDEQVWQALDETVDQLDS